MSYLVLEHEPEEEWIETSLSAKQIQQAGTRVAQHFRQHLHIRYGMPEDPLNRPEDPSLTQLDFVNGRLWKAGDDFVTPAEWRRLVTKIGKVPREQEFKILEQQGLIRKPRDPLITREMLTVWEL